MDNVFVMYTSRQIYICISSYKLNLREKYGIMSEPCQRQEKARCIQCTVPTSEPENNYEVKTADLCRQGAPTTLGHGLA